MPTSTKRIHARSPKEIRSALHLPRIVVAVRAGVSEPSVRAYENNPDHGVTEPIQSKLAPVYADMAAELLKAS